ncbi:MAG: glycosyltransferase family 4 protein, partial [Actinomycetota bacterium]
MRFLIDARPALDPRRTGIGTYAARLVEHLPAEDPDDTFVAWYLHVRGLLRPRTFFTPRANLVEAATRLPARLFQPVASRLEVPRLEWLAPFDAMIATNFLPPPTRSRAVVLAVHDLAFTRLPETAPQMDARFRRRFHAALASCAAAIVPSQVVRDDLMASGDIEFSRIRVVHHGVDPFVAPTDASARVAALGVTGPYALFVGGLEPRKNLERLIEAFGRVPGEATLVIAGGPVRWFPSYAARLDGVVDALPRAVARRIRRVGYVNELDRAALLAGATLLAYPSLEEGFGFPVLEAMVAGVPVLSADRSSIPEIAGDAANLVEPTDVDALAGGLSLLLTDAGERG